MYMYTRNKCIICIEEVIMLLKSNPIPMHKFQTDIPALQIHNNIPYNITTNYSFSIPSKYIINVELIANNKMN